MEAQPWRMAVTASVPLDVLRFFQSVTLPVKRELDKTPVVWELPYNGTARVLGRSNDQTL